jgi:hypothetical protein
MKKSTKRLHDMSIYICNIWDWNIANFLITVLATIFAGAALWWVWPRQASPAVVDIRLYDGGGGHAANFPFMCQFVVRNDGDRPCELEKFEILLENTSYRYARSVCQGRIVLDGPPAPMVTSSTLPVYIGRNSQQEIIIIGEGTSSNPSSPDLPKEIPVKLIFSKKGGEIIITKKVMVTRDYLGNMSF